MSQLLKAYQKSVDEYPEKIALICDEESLTYDELDKLVESFATRLSNHNLKKNDLLGILMDNSKEAVIALLASMKLGIGIVPVSPSMPTQTLEKQFSFIGIKVLIGREAVLKRLMENNQLKVEYIAFQHTDMSDTLLDSNSTVSLNSQIELTGEEPFIITMTSGSTGDPKPILLTQNNKYIRAQEHIKMYNLTSKDVVLAATPLYHSLAERLILMPLLTGATAVLLSRFTVPRWLTIVEQAKVTFTIAVSSQLAQIEQYVSNDQTAVKLSSLRGIVSSSALLNTHVKEELIETLDCEIHEMYGTSETSTVTTINLSEAKERSKSVGRTFPNVEIQILDNEDVPVKFGEVGEIACKSPMLCKTYFKRDKQFITHFVNGYFKTGDLGYLDQDGYLYFTGRKKELIITGGINVYPPDIENCILKLESVSEVAAFSVEDDYFGEIVAVMIVLKGGEYLSTRDVQKHCMRHLSDYQQPRKIYFSTELPKNEMGKVVKSEIVKLIKEH